MRRLFYICALVIGGLTSPSVGWAQESETQPKLPTSDVLTIDSDVLFTQSLFGLRVSQDVVAKETVLSTENRRIQAELTAEELALTEKRKEMSAEDFRAVAEAFDARVVQFRQQQDQKLVDIERGKKLEEEKFVQAASPILTELMQEAGAKVVMERRNVLLLDPSIDITSRAILRLNQTLGDGRTIAGSD